MILPRYTYATGDIYEGTLKDDEYLDDGNYIYANSAVNQD